MAENSNNTKNKNPKRRSVSEKSKFSSKKQRESSVSPKNAKSKKTKSKKNTKSRLNLFLSFIFLAACVSLAVIVLSKDEKKEESVIAKNIEGKNIENPKEQSQKNIKKDLNPVQNQKNTENQIKSSPKEKLSATSNEKSNSPSEKPLNLKEKNIENPKEKKNTPSKSLPPVKTKKENLLKTEKQVPAFKIPPAKNKATIVLVIDDAGLNVENTKKYASLPFPLTIAVLPKLSHSKECAQVVHDFGKELILHQPMQSLNKNLDPGPGKITVDMSFSQIESVINENLRELGPFVKGMNNHEGSQVTEDIIRIGAVIDICQQNGIYFLDSRTTPNTKAPQAALERDIKIFEKSGPYIDNVVDRNAMVEEMYKALDIANKNGKTIIIGHVDKSANVLPQLLLEMYPHIVKAGYSFATPSMLKK
ncbi:divergent polysaccharide deacetylase family protein [Treponema pectinovorum]|uniref:divergent polysaccharide deacetylase family protein n=1 Tax=Treponema pectinovorum TaxID=164 RepID=UPI0011C76003|nr:divergent polysaccharide deacetylase family protein [Treponema pectinovorum]